MQKMHMFYQTIIWLGLTGILLAEGYLHPASKVKLPRQLHGLTLGEEQVVEVEGLKEATVKYKAKGSSTDGMVYIAELGSEKTTLEKEIKERLKWVRKSGQNGTYMELKIKIDEKVSKSGWLAAMYGGIWKIDGKPFVTVILMKLGKKHSVELRFASGVPVDKNLKRMISTLQKSVDESLDKGL